MNNVENLRPFKRICMTIGNLPTAYLESMSYYECLTYMYKYLENQVIPVVNNNTEVLKELQEYISNYFDNLDVQEEINNKLDEMATGGELVEIISAYLEMQSLITFETVSEMKDATNLIEGSNCKTLGYTTAGDRGGAIYKIREITEEDTPDEASLIAIGDTLVAELIIFDKISIDQFGCIGDGVTSDKTNLEKALNYAKSNKITLITGGKEYYISGNISIDGIIFDLNGGTLLMNNYAITLTNNATLKNGIIKNGNVVLNGGKNNLSVITFKEFINSAITINSNGYEDYINDIRLENNSNSTATVGITNNASDETISYIYGYGCYKGIVSNGSDNYYEDIHLWLNNNNTFSGSRFIEITNTYNYFINCCSDSYNTCLYFAESYLLVNLTNLNFINNNILFSNKDFIFADGETTGALIIGDVQAKLTGFTSANNTFSINYGSKANFTFIDNYPVEKIGGYNYAAIQPLVTGANTTVNGVSSIYLNGSKLNINLTLYTSGTSTNEISVDLTDFLEINKYESRGYLPAIYNNYQKLGIVEYYLTEGVLTFSIPSLETGTSFSAISCNLVINK